jgi:REP element-mobilizing transposase RayT
MFSGYFNKNTGNHNRKSIRLQGYDYSQPGYYFVTICIHDRIQKIFGDIVNGKMVLNNAGQMAEKCWVNIPIHFPIVCLKEHVVMPNHIHGIIRILNRRGTACRAPVCEPPGTACRAHDGTDVELTVNASHGGNESGTACRAPVCEPPGTACRAPTRTVVTTVTNERFGNPVSGTLPTIVRSYKSAVSKYVHTFDMNFKWQRNYFERIIRDEKSLFAVRKYICDNPKKWFNDMNHKIDDDIPMFEHDRI